MIFFLNIVLQILYEMTVEEKKLEIVFGVEITAQSSSPLPCF